MYKTGFYTIFKTKFHDLSITFSMTFAPLFPCVPAYCTGKLVTILLRLCDTRLLRSLFYSAILVNKHRNAIPYSHHSKTVEPRKLNFGHNMEIKKNIVHANLGGLRSRDRDSGNQNPGENGHFCTEYKLIRL